MRSSASFVRENTRVTSHPLKSAFATISAWDTTPSFSIILSSTTSPTPPSTPSSSSPIVLFQSSPSIVANDLPSLFKTTSKMSHSRSSSSFPRENALSRANIANACARTDATVRSSALSPSSSFFFFRTISTIVRNSSSAFDGVSNVSTTENSPSFEMLETRTSSLLTRCFTETPSSLKVFLFSLSKTSLASLIDLAVVHAFVVVVVVSKKKTDFFVFFFFEAQRRRVVV